MSIYPVRPIALACLLSCFLTPVFANSSKGTFTSSEHTDIGNQIRLHYASGDDGQTGQPLSLPNGLQLSYGTILTMGDFYEIVDQPISEGQSEAERRSRFLAAFSSLALQSHALIEVPLLVEAFATERKLIDDALASGQPLDDLFKTLGHTFDIKYNCITGGGCTEATWLIDQGRYLKLANKDYDHFSDNAELTYSIGHQLAMEEAVAAHQTNDINKLELAYAMNAFASHFLTDRFSTGHMRTPRVELTVHTTPATIGSVLASYMHGEENSYGLHVANPRGDRWIAYGDKSYFKPQTAIHRNHIHEAVQASADDIFTTYLTGRVVTDSPVSSLIPKAVEAKDKGVDDISAMFYWDQDGGQLYRRSHLTRPFDRTWTTSWWGWSTLVELKAIYGLSDSAQAELAHSELSDKALKEGLITEPSLVKYVKSK